MSNSPSTYWNARPTLERLAAAGMLVYCRCYGCRKTRTYLASDLAEYFGPSHVVGEIFGQCPDCGFAGNWRERYRYPSNNDVWNGTVIRKLIGWRQSAIWADEPYQSPGQFGPFLPPQHRSRGN